MADEMPSVLLYVLTYNHASYIGQCLQSIVSQKLSIPFLVLVIDDCSTDGTADIIRDYAKKYPHIIKAVLREKNIGVRQGQPRELDDFTPKYFNQCEGDDYFSDNLKLQKQVDFLDAHPECSMCFHPATVFYQDGSRPNSILPTPEQRGFKDRMTFDDLLKGNFIATNSVLYRWRYGAGREKYHEIFPRGIMPGDWYTHLLHAEVGEIGFIDEAMSVYRRHAGGLWSGVEGRPEFFIQHGLGMLRFFDEMEKRFHVDKLSQKLSLFLDTIESNITTGETAKADAIIRSSEYLELLKPKRENGSASLSGHFFKAAYYYHFGGIIGWSCGSKPRRVKHLLSKSLAQCLRRNDEKRFHRLLSRYVRIVS